MKDLKRLTNKHLGELLVERGSINQEQIAMAMAYQKEHVVPYAQQAFGFEGTYGCGLCQTKVPCESCCPD